MLWECDGCLIVIQDNPCGHTDYGGEIIVYGPYCCQCGQPMQFISECHEGYQGVESF